MEFMKAKDACVVGSKWRHVRRGTLYVVSGFCRLEATWKIAVLYIPLDSKGLMTGDVTPIARDADEFLDGRFVRVPDEPEAQADSEMMV